MFLQMVGEYGAWSGLEVFANSSFSKCHGTRLLPSSEPRFKHSMHYTWENWLAIRRFVGDIHKVGKDLNSQSKDR